MKSGQLIEDNVKIFFIKNNAENEVERLVPDLFLLFYKALYKVITISQHVLFKICW